MLSRGFIYMKESGQLLNEAQAILRDEIEELLLDTEEVLNERSLRNKITDVLGTLLFKKTERHPKGLPVILGVTEADTLE